MTHVLTKAYMSYQHVQFFFVETDRSGFPVFSLAETFFIVLFYDCSNKRMVFATLFRVRTTLNVTATTACPSALAAVDGPPV